MPSTIICIKDPSELETGSNNSPTTYIEKEANIGPLMNLRYCDILKFKFLISNPN